MKHKTQPSGTNKKSGLSFVVCRTVKLRAMVLGLIVCGLIITTVGHAQRDPLAPIADVPVNVDDDAINLPAAIKRGNEAAARDGLERFQKWVREEIDPLSGDQQAFIEEARLEKALRKFNTHIPLNAMTGHRYSTNSYGANYSIPHGSFRGDGLVGLDEFWVLDFRGNPATRDRTITQGRAGDRSIGNGWSFEPGGFLKETYHTVHVEINPGVTQCSVVLRYSYSSANGGTNFQQRGVEQARQFDLQGEIGADFCAANARDHFIDSRPTQFWSNDGQIALDMSNPNRPVMLYPDGTSMALAMQATSAYIPFNAGLFDFLQSAESIDRLWFTSQSITRNGQITTYTYDRTTGWLSSVTDFRGRVTQYQRDGLGRVIVITAPGPGGRSMSWKMTWQDFTWNPASLFDEIPCLSNGSPAQCPNLLAYTTLTRFQLPDPDLRSYTFSYGPWGNLTRVMEPDGAVRDFEYGDATTSAFMPPGSWLPGSLQNLPLYTLNLQRRRVKATTIYPQGLGGPANTTKIRHENTDDMPPGAQCSRLNWIKRTYPNGDIGREALCSQQPGTNRDFDSKTFAQETWRAGVLVSAAYYGNLDTFGDPGTPVGSMYIDTETSHDPVQSDSIYPYLDIRPNKVVRFKDGVRWTEEFTYEQSDIPADGGTFRTTGNVTIKRIRDASDALFFKSVTTYFHNGRAAYIGRNLLRLPSSVILKAGSDVNLTRTDYFYDQFDPTASGAPNLDTTIGSVRGNVTTVTSYGDAVSGALPVSSETHYFDTGDVQLSLDPLRRNPTTNTYTFGLCSNNPLLTSTATNVLGHQTRAVSDCFSGLTLSVTDPNGQSVYSQYDNLGRLAETAGPGDSLTSLPDYLRDPNAQLNGGSVVGNNGQGPTSWIEYFRFGIEALSINQQRTVTHSKDGTADGRYVKTFVDGLGRSVQTRAEVDPVTSGGNRENLATTEYDNMGRVSKSYVPCFSSASDAVTAHCTSLGTTTEYDALGRATRVTQPGSLIMTTAYSGSGTQWLTTVTDPNSNSSKSFTDVLGRTVKSSRQWTDGGAACSDPDLGQLWCSTTMNYDAAGRLLSTTDPGGNVISFIYDSLGRKQDMTDPDMGHWHYEYDNNGNLISQTDAKGQTITMQYDVLNRLKVKDLPLPGPGEEDEVYFYDGDQPPTCYSCDDHCAGTTDTCDAGTGTCVHTGTPCDAGPPPSPSPSPTPAPAAPSNLTATAASSVQINLQWIDNSNNETGFKIERSTDGGATFSLITTVSANATSYSNNGLSSGTTYHYRVKATNGSGDSSPSNVASAMTQSALPTIPANLVATAVSSSQINLTWTSSSNHTGYILERSLASGAGFTPIATPAVNATSYSDTAPGASTRYYYRIKSTNGAQQSGYSNEASAVTFNAPPAAPSNLTATAFSSSQINLSWQDNSNNESAFTVERYDSSFPFWIEVGWPAANVTSFSNVGLPASTTLSYRVKAINSGGSSLYSNVTTVTTLSGSDTPAAPSNLQATAVSGTKVRLTWQDNSNNEFGFALERNSGAGFVEINGFSANTTTYADTILSPATNYSYRVRALSGAACCHSAYSNLANVATPSYFSLATNGGQWFEAPSSSSLDVDGPSLTVEAWVKSDVDYRTCTVCPAQNIVSRFNLNATTGIDGGYELRISGAGKLQFAVYRNGTHYGLVSSGSGYTMIPIRPGEWHHVAGVYNNLDGTLSVYVDGVRTGSAPADYGTHTGTSALKIGRSDDPNDPSFFIGKIDEVRISAEAVYTGSGIVDYYSLAHLSPRPGGTTRGLWKFDVRTGTDTSGYNNMGAVQGGATYSSDVPDFTVALNFGPREPETALSWMRYSFANDRRLAIRSSFIWAGG